MPNIRLDIKFSEPGEKIPFTELHFIEGKKEFSHLLEKKNGEIRCWTQDGLARISVMRRGRGELLREENILIRYGTEIGWAIASHFQSTP